MPAGRRTYHEAQLAALVQRVADAVDRHRAGELDAIEVDEVISSTSARRGSCARSARHRPHHPAHDPGRRRPIRRRGLRLVGTQPAAPPPMSHRPAPHPASEDARGVAVDLVQQVVDSFATEAVGRRGRSQGRVGASTTSRICERRCSASARPESWSMPAEPDHNPHATNPPELTDLARSQRVLAPRTHRSADAASIGAAVRYEPNYPRSPPPQ